MIGIQAAAGVSRMISITLLRIEAACPGIVFASSDFSKAFHDWTQPANRAKTDDPQLGQRGLHVDPSTVNISSQSMQSKASFSFMSSSSPPHIFTAGQARDAGNLPLRGLKESGKFPYSKYKQKLAHVTGEADGRNSYSNSSG